MLKKSPTPSTPSEESLCDDGLAEHICDLINHAAQGDEPWKLREFDQLIKSAGGLTQNEREFLLRHLAKTVIATQRSVLKKELSQYAVGNKNTVADVAGKVERLGQPEARILGNTTKSSFDNYLKNAAEAQRNISDGYRGTVTYTNNT